MAVAKVMPATSSKANMTATIPTANHNAKTKPSIVVGREEATNFKHAILTHWTVTGIIHKCIGVVELQLWHMLHNLRN